MACGRRIYGRGACETAARTLQQALGNSPWPRPGSTMGLIRLIAAPIRSILRFPLFQLAVVVIIVLVLQAASDNSVFGQIFNALDKLVDATVTLCSQLFEVKSFTRSGLTAGLMIGYVYLACLLILYVLQILVGLFIDLIGWSNAFGLRNTIARERGIAAYRAWLPLERIRPTNVPQERWEETFAWPADNGPPYPPLGRRILHTVFSYLAVIVAAAVLLQIFTPFPVLTWSGKLIETLAHR
ncbi:MAG TPA: hypothetical protein VMR17_18045 [Xanthobacteraceae bacterium]|nr:hypothetical protein [Xanthobacteraceae bacterium]